ncbi:hypothetical protein V6N12_076440 [Hibiscus sabdariffa]|uniref:Uncharacterized protein n=1 Tax=Hibiscus sabdariffa TaxID=183260 RepID=A0ABR2DBJ2_9ROSI
MSITFGSDSNKLKASSFSIIDIVDNDPKDSIDPSLAITNHDAEEPRLLVAKGDVNHMVTSLQMISDILLEGKIMAFKDSEIQGILADKVNDMIDFLQKSCISDKITVDNKADFEESLQLDSKKLADCVSLNADIFMDIVDIVGCENVNDEGSYVEGMLIQDDVSFLREGPNIDSNTVADNLAQDHPHYK